MEGSRRFGTFKNVQKVSKRFKKFQEGSRRFNKVNVKYSSESFQKILERIPKEEHF